MCNTTLADLYWRERKYKCPALPTVQPTTYCAHIMCMADYFVEVNYTELEPDDLIVVVDSNTCKVAAATAAAAAAKSGSVLTASLTAVSVAIYATMF